MSHHLGFKKVPYGTKCPQEPVVEPPQNSKSSSAKKANNGESGSPRISAWSHASEGTQLAITVLLFVYLGRLGDNHFGSSPWLTLVGSFFGIIVGLYNFLKTYLRRK